MFDGLPSKCLSVRVFFPTGRCALGSLPLRPVVWHSRVFRLAGGASGDGHSGGHHTQAPPSGHHTQAPPSGHHTQAPPSGQQTATDYGSDTWRRTVILMERQTSRGQDLFMRGGVDHSHSPGWRCVWGGRGGTDTLIITVSRKNTTAGEKKSNGHNCKQI